MIKAEHKNWARLVFNPYLKRLLKKNFNNFYLTNEVPKIQKNKSILITPNHISWWDGFFIDFAVRNIFHKNIFLMMLEEQLKRFWFFSKLGAYSINPGNVKSVLETVNYTSLLLEKPGNFLVVYPQGEIEAYEKKPLTLKKGLDLIIKKSKKDFIILPAAYKIQYYNEKNPSVLFSFGNMLDSKEIENNFAVFENTFYQNLDDLSQKAFDRQFIRDLF
jgi:1-acyl-sn-glycerol-3-phosphate acyltransferase